MSSTVYGVDLVEVPSPPAGLPSGGAGNGAVSWAAIIAGAVAALATTLILLILGTGIGFASISPWYGAGASVTAVGVTAVIWVVVVQWLSSVLGGYVAGRLRTRWTGVHTHEVFFRDTVHGFLSWAVASIAGALLFVSATALSVAGITTGASEGAARSMESSQAPTMQNAGAGLLTANPVAYYTQSLFRSASPAVSDRTDSAAELAQIFANNVHNGQIELSPPDRAYAINLVAVRTGVSQGEAAQRVDTAVDELNGTAQRARAAADTARKRAAQLSIIAALSMVIGAFVASAAAAFGGSLRDEY